MLRWGHQSRGWRAVAARRGRPYGSPEDASGRPRDGGLIMYRVIAVVACGFTLTACSSWMPSFELPSMPSFGGGGSGAASLAVESDPPGAQASAGGASCVTPCRLNVAVNGPFNVTVALNGYAPQSIPVRVMQPDDPRLNSEEMGTGGVRLDPNPVYVELERAAPPPPPPKKKPKRPAVSSRQTAPVTAQGPAPAPSAPTTAVAPTTAPAPAVQQPTSSTQPWPMPR
jgi:PEGA domain